MPPGGFAAQAVMAASRALRVASRRALLLEPGGARTRLNAPLVPPPADHVAEFPLTVKHRHELPNIFIQGDEVALGVKHGEFDPAGWHCA